LEQAGRKRKGQEAPGRKERGAKKQETAKTGARTERCDVVIELALDKALRLGVFALSCF
jgi:hypothetical protein